ncbi:MAG TPA: aspartate aminotransferase family protein [Acidimicrobiia bacterium]|nr:aspartate aminotransferase family protein [Acidimicrobiia bacterium]
MQGPLTADWFTRARAALVNGVSSGFRYLGDDDTLVIARGEGGHVYDMDGKRYIDYQCAWGPIILGHADPFVTEAVTAAARDGTTFAMTQRREVEAAEAILGAIKWAGKIRFTNTGTEATMHALRLARGWAGRDLVVKFEGHYHGTHDYLLFTTAGAPPAHLGSRLRPIPYQASSGIPDSIRTYVRTLPFNDLDAVDDFFDDHGHEIAAVITEPMAGNAFGILPEPGFLERLRVRCSEYDAVLIFDEVKTGFRLSLGGAVETFGVVPDIATYAKALGNGFPVAAIALSDTLVEGWAGGGIAQAGTYSGNGVAVAAASATLDRLQHTDAYARIEKVGRSLMEGLGAILAETGVEGMVLGHPAMFSIYLGEGRPVDYRAIAPHNARLYGAVVEGMIDRGVMPCIDAREPWFICAAHTMDDVAVTLEAFRESLREALAQAGTLPSHLDEAD